MQEGKISERVREGMHVAGGGGGGSYEVFARPAPGVRADGNDGRRAG